MFSTFTLDAPNATHTASIWDLLVSAGYINSLGYRIISGPTVTSGIQTDRVNLLKCSMTEASAGTITFYDRYGTAGTVISNDDALAPQAVYELGPMNRNSICLKEIFPQGSDGSEDLIITVESI